MGTPCLPNTEKSHSSFVFVNDEAYWMMIHNPFNTEQSHSLLPQASLILFQVIEGVNTTSFSFFQIQVHLLVAMSELLSRPKLTRESSKYNKFDKAFQCDESNNESVKSMTLQSDPFLECLDDIEEFLKSVDYT